MRHLRSYQLAVQFYREAKAISLPHYLKDQLRRAALSVALNISEGFLRRSESYTTCSFAPAGRARVVCLIDSDFSK